MERKNFMKPEFKEPMEKRVQFAVELRKKKTQKLIENKRRKIMQCISQQIEQLGGNSA